MTELKNTPKKLKYQDIIDKMTLKEKVSLMSGENFWNTKALKQHNIPSIMMTDGPHGLRKQGGKADHLGLNKSIPATCFPTAATLANSWDKDLLYEVGSYLGKEAAEEDVSILLGPGLNIKRNPLCGRNFEYFSEDPYLCGILAQSMVEGIQSMGVSACPKHFAVNSQETRRMVVDEVIDRRALHEIYLKGFKHAIIDGKAKAVMTSYNRLNGTYANENTYLLRTVLEKQWGFDGLIVTDWGGSNNRVDGLIAGNQLEMPATNGLTDIDILQALKDGTLDENILNQRVDSLLKIIFSLDENKTAYKKLGERVYKNLHHQEAVEAATRSIVLLKNQDNILPLKGNEKIGVIGDFAETPRYQGAGSSLINPTKLDRPLDFLETSGLNIIGFENGFKRYGKSSSSLKNKAVILAKNSDIVLLFIGLDESAEAEGVDRKHMRLPKNQLELFDEIYKVNKNIIVVLAGGAPVELPFYEKAKGILHGYLLGQGSGPAITDVITGKYNPSGKLSETYPHRYEDVSSAPYFPGLETAEHRESIFIGYRYFDTVKKDVLFPFGYGLSYTNFSYKDLEVSKNSVTFSLKNTGDLFGEEVAQVYIKAKGSKVFRAEKELKGFTKIPLDKNESNLVTIPLDDQAFSYYNTDLNRFIEEPGEYEILVGASSKDIRLTGSIVIEGEMISSPYKKDELKNYFDLNISNITDEEFEALLGFSVLKPKQIKVLSYNNTVGEGRYAGRFGRFLASLVFFVHKFLMFINRPIAANNVLFALELPFRSVARMSGGKVDMFMLDGLLVMINGNFFKGAGRFIKGFFTKKKRAIKALEEFD